MRLKVKISCMDITSPSMPTISEIDVTLRVPSAMRETWMIKLIAEATCCRTARSGMLRFAIATIVSAPRGTHLSVIDVNPEAPLEAP